MENEKITVWQHYVPRMYLKNFGKIMNKRKNSVSLVSFYQFNKNLYKDEISVESICAKDYFYDNDNHIEKTLSNLEGNWAECFNRLIYNEMGITPQLNDCDINMLKSFAVYQYMRTQAAYEHTKKMTEELYYILFHEKYPQYSEEDVKKEIKNIVEKGISPEDHIKMVSPLLTSINDLELRIIKNKTSELFITSDVPIIVTNAFESNRGGGLANIGSILFFPISGKHLISIYDGKLYKCVSDEIDDVEEVKNINKYQVLNAEERIVAFDSGDLEKYINDDILMDLRNRTRNSNATINAVGENSQDSIINAKSRSVPYEFRLKMFELPYKYKRIPFEAKEVFKRAYDPESRKALLYRAKNVREIYKECLGDKVAKYDRKRIQKGYCDLLDLYDDYWNVPLKDRIKPSDIPNDDFKPSKTQFYKIN